MSANKWIPELVYEEGSNVPFISVPQDEEMPDKLFVFEYKETGEMTPGPNGEDIPIADVELHMYFNYNKAKELLDVDTLNKVRLAFGLEDLESAIEKGKKITQAVVDNADMD
jgi:hypothetical protein